MQRGSCSTVDTVVFTVVIHIVQVELASILGLEDMLAGVNTKVEELF